MERIEALVIGGGSAGLAVSHELTRDGIEHVVLERGRIGQSWRNRWDSFCLATPNWSVRLPDGVYDGSDPDGFMLRDEIVTFMEQYASRSGTPVREGVEVRSLRSTPGGGFIAATSGGELQARQVVLATGAYQRPHRPAGSAGLPEDIMQFGS